MIAVILHMAVAPSSWSSQVVSSKLSLFIVYSSHQSLMPYRLDIDLVKNSEMPIETLVKVSN